MEGILRYDRMIDERSFYFGEEHENQIAKELDSLTLDTPILLVGDNYDYNATENYYAVKMTQRTLDFLKEHRDWDYDYELYLNYTFEEKPFSKIDIKALGSNETLLAADLWTEEEFEEREIKEWAEVAEWENDPANKERGNGLLEAIADFHNRKWHNGEEFWEVDNGNIVHKEE